MSQAEMFEKLGAPLNNVRWSWGSVRASDGTVFMRVWQDGTQKIEEKRFIWISEETPPSHDLGADERLRHVKLVQAGAACYLIMCQAVDSGAAPRAVQTFNRNEVFTSGDIVLFKGAYWLELKGRVPLREVCVCPFTETSYAVSDDSYRFAFGRFLPQAKGRYGS